MARVRPTPIDPLGGPKLALAGRVVTLDAARRVLSRGVVFIDQGRIVDVRETGEPRPAGFEGLAPIDVGGTIYPGLIELHNHLSYNALRLWNVPRKFTNRSQWGGVDGYRRWVSGPMTVVGRTPRLLPAVVRYVECKCLVAGVTTSQGIELFSNAGARRHYRGVVRNVEQTDDADLPEAQTKIADVEARNAELFFNRLRRQTCFLLHLSEGVDAAARRHFEALKLPNGRWAITDALAGIHAAALRRDDFEVLAAHGGSMVWSPLSNFLLYGKTADVSAAKASGVRIGLGSDWSPTGSKNLLFELKVAKVASQVAGDVFSDRELVEMVTRNAAAILKWDRVLGTIEPGKRADLLVVEGRADDPYTQLIGARETDIRLCMINGVARLGMNALMESFVATAGEPIRIGGRLRRVFLDQTTGDPDVAAVSLSDARERLADALGRLPELARELERRPLAMVSPFGVGAGPVVWLLALDELEPTGMDLRPRLPMPGEVDLTGPDRVAEAPTRPLSEILQPLTLDPLTVADDPDFLPGLLNARNVPLPVKEGLRGFA